MRQSGLWGSRVVTPPTPPPRQRQHRDVEDKENRRLSYFGFKREPDSPDPKEETSAAGEARLICIDDPRANNTDPRANTDAAAHLQEQPARRPLRQRRAAATAAAATHATATHAASSWSDAATSGLSRPLLPP